MYILHLALKTPQSSTDLELEFQLSPVSSLLTFDRYDTTQFHRQRADQNTYSKQHAAELCSLNASSTTSTYSIGLA